MSPSLTDPLLAKLDALLDQAVRVVPRPRTTFSSAIRAMHAGRYDAPLHSGRHDAPRGRFPRLEVHEMLARDITAAVDAGEPAGRESEFLKRVSVRLAQRLELRRWLSGCVELASYLRIEERELTGGIDHAKTVPLWIGEDDVVRIQGSFIPVNLSRAEGDQARARLKLN